MSQSEGFLDPTEPAHVCKHKKALYSLKQAPRPWFQTLRTTLLKWGFSNSIYDASLFYKHKHGLLLLFVYVDDILITGENKADVHQVIEDLQQAFALKTLGSVYYFLGFEVMRTPDGLHLSLGKYAADLLQKTYEQCQSKSYSHVHEQ